MIDQYKEETSQIHAPADLILKTKQAVREEEKRIEWEKAQQEQNVHRRTMVRRTKSGYSKTNRWVFPVAAAVLLVILMNVSVLMIENAAEEFADMDAGMDKAFADKELPTESAVAAGEEGAAYDMYEDSVTEASETAGYDDVESAVNESAMSEDVGKDLSITEVEEIPPFYDDPNTESITVYGLQFYVARERGNKWKAYVCVDETGYVITGSGEEIPDRKSFAEEAYELLAETVEGIE